MAEYVYKQTERGEYPLWTVGSYGPGGEWEPESDHGSSEEAADRVRFLNGDRSVINESALRKQRDRLLGVAMRIIRNCERGRASRHQFADGKAGLAGCDMSLDDIEEARAAYMMVTAKDPFRQVKVGPLSDRHPGAHPAPDVSIDD